MNVLYIFGNGLDIAQGMKTSYREFYEYLFKESVGLSPVMNQLLNHIKSDIKLWSDMEEALGAFTSKLDSQQVFEDLYFEINKQLRSYLTKQDSRYKPSSQNQRRFCHDLLHFDEYLGETDRNRFTSFINNDIPKSYYSKVYEEYIDEKPLITRNVITFNYTHTLEKLIVDEPDRIWYHDVDINQIIHVHGSLSDTIVFGVDNESQISNNSFKENDDIKDILVKNQSNLSLKLQRSTNCEQFIKEANVIVLFGVSLGETDSRWWKLIGEQLKTRRDICIVQFVYSPLREGQESKLLEGRIERNQKEKLMKRMDLDNKEDVAERLFFIVNSDAFKRIRHRLFDNILGHTY